MMTLPELLRSQGRRVKARNLRPVRPSRQAEAAYRNELLALVRLMRQAVNEDVLSLLRTQDERYTRDAPDGDIGRSFMEAIDAGLSKAANRFGGLNQWASRIAEQQVRRVDKQVKETVGSTVRNAFGIDVEPIMMMQDLRLQVEAARIVNVNLIKSVKEKYFDKISSSVLNGVMQGTRSADIAREIQSIASITEARAKFIARDQTAKMNSSFNEIRQTDLGIEEYTWQTSGDERVRPDHAENDGKVFRWDKPPSTGHPGQEFQCRCVAVPKVRIEGYR